MKVSIKRSELLKLCYVCLQVIAAAGYVFASGCTQVHYYGSMFGGVPLGGVLTLLTTAVPQFAVPAFVMCLPAVLGVAAGEDKPFLGRASWAIDLVLASCLLAAALIYSAPEALAGVLLLAVGAAMGSRIWPSGILITTTGDDER